MTEDKTLTILLRLKDEATGELKKFSGQMSTLQEKTKQSSQELEKHNKSAIKSFNESTRPLTSLIRSVGRIGLIWGVTFGAMVKAVDDVGKAIDNLDVLAIKLGRNASDLSKEFYGFDITTKEVKTGTNALKILFDDLSNSIMRAKVEITKFVGEAATLEKQQGLLKSTIGKLGILGFAASQFMPDKMTKEQAESGISKKAQSTQAKKPEAIQAEIDYTNLYEQLTLSQVAFKQQQFDKQILLLQKYNVDTSLIEKEQHFRQAQDQFSEIAKQNAARLTAEGDLTSALANEQAVQLIAFKRVWGENGEVVNAFLRAQKAMSDTKVWENFKKTLTAVGAGFGELSSAMTQYAGENKKMAKAAAVVAMASALVSGALAVINALATKPFFPVGLIMGALAAAMVGFQIATIASQKFAQGTDNVPAMLSVGEMVIPRTFSDAIRAGDLTLGGERGRQTNNSNVNVYIEQASFNREEDIQDIMTRLSFLIETRRRGKI